MNLLKTNETVQRITPKMVSHVQFQITKVNNYLRAYSMKLTGNEFDRNDLYQDTVFRIISNAEKFTQGSNFKAWATTIMRNIFINNYRKKKKQATNLDSTSDNFYLNSGHHSIENKGETNIAYKELLRMIGRLPEAFKRPFLMSYRGYKYEEIAEELEAPVGTIKSRIFFARQKLQKMYGQRTPY